ncbi:MAG: hypothetical protein WC956_05485 [bacterium]
MGKRNRTGFEILVVVVVVALTLVMGASLYAGRAKVEKTSLLLSELGMLRSSLMTYRLVNHRNAQDLFQLANEKYEADGAEKPYIERLPMNDKGAVVDPFGNPYAYDPNSGWVSSSTPGFERW